MDNTNQDQIDIIKLNTYFIDSHKTIMDFIVKPIMQDSNDSEVSLKLTLDFGGISDKMRKYLASYESTNNQFITKFLIANLKSTDKKQALNDEFVKSKNKTADDLFPILIEQHPGLKNKIMFDYNGVIFDNLNGTNILLIDGNKVMLKPKKKIIIDDMILANVAVKNENDNLIIEDEKTDSTYKLHNYIPSGVTFNLETKMDDINAIQDEVNTIKRIFKNGTIAHDRLNNAAKIKGILANVNPSMSDINTHLETLFKKIRGLNIMGTNAYNREISKIKELSKIK